MNDAHTAGGTVQCRADAVRAIDLVLSSRSEGMDAALIFATGCLVRYRNEMIRRLRENAADVRARRELAQANGALSLLFSTQYPVVGLHWERLKKLRDALDQLSEKRTS